MSRLLGNFKKKSDDRSINMGRNSLQRCLLQFKWLDVKWLKRLSLLGLLLLSAVGSLQNVAPWGVLVASSEAASAPEFYPGLGGDFSLHSAEGKRRLSKIPGEWKLIGFGYSHCPDVCSMLLAKINQVYRKLGDQRDDVSVIFISIDAARDGSEAGLKALQTFVSRFNGQFIGLSGSKEEIDLITKQYGIYYGAEGDTISHTDRIYLVNANGRVKKLFSRTAETEVMAEEILQLFDR